MAKVQGVGCHTINSTHNVNSLVMTVTMIMKIMLGRKKNGRQGRKNKFEEDEIGQDFRVLTIIISTVTRIYELELMEIWQKDPVHPAVRLTVI